MLIILPPSETKRPAPESGRPLALNRLSFAELTPFRSEILEALVATSASPGAFEMLRVRPTLVDEVVNNLDVHVTPTRPAAEVYSGALYSGLDWSSLTPTAQRSANSDVVISSAAWGLLRPNDQIPTYRLHICAWLEGIGRLEPYWRQVVPDVLARSAGPAGVIVDLRSPTFQAMGKPTAMTDRTVTLRVLPEAGARSIGDVVAKRVRGQVARELVETNAKPNTPDELADALSDTWPVRLEPPTATKTSWTLLVRPQD